MQTNASRQPAVYELPLSADAPQGQPSPPATALSQLLLFNNAEWFCRLRWVVIAVLLGFGLLGQIDAAITYVGLQPPGIWPFLIAAVLIVGNILFLLHLKLGGRLTGPRMAIMNLWGQIIMDLLVLTAVVYALGSFRTSVPFAYLFHIALACIFLSSRQSLVVTMIAAMLFLLCLSLEGFGVLQPRDIFADAASMHLPFSKKAAALGWASATAIWVVVWYLISHLAEMVRQRDIKLAETNRRLLAAQEERSRHMLVTTHQLKAPFAAIHANTQILLQGYCGKLPGKAFSVLERIAARCQRLAAEIQEMLQLANLSSTSQSAMQDESLDMPVLLKSCLSHIEPLALMRHISFSTDLRPAAGAGVEDHVRMLLINILANAVTYSHEGGQVRVACASGPSGEVAVTISDDGIGIADEKLPHIFEEHYRTKEAVRHNKESSGLGLAIVKQVAQMHKIGLRVISTPMVGTTFEVTFPPDDHLQDPPSSKEKDDGLRVDHR